MQEQTTHHTLPPEEPGNGEAIAQEDGTAEAAASNEEAAAEGRVTSTLRKRPEPPPTEPVEHVTFTIPEWLRGKDGTLKSCEATYTVPSAEASILHEMVARSKYTRDPLTRIPFPAHREAYGTTEELFARIKLAIAEQTQLSDKDSALLTFWVFSTWFQDVLPLAPGLAITGWPHDGDLVLRALHACCYHPILLAGLTGATLNNIHWQLKPTLLISEPALSARMAVLLGSSTCRGYMARIKMDGCPSRAFDYYGSKAVYLGEDPSTKSMLQHFVFINSSSSRPASESQSPQPVSEEMTLSLQNQLLKYRIDCHRRVFASDFSSSGLSPEANAIANALGRCIVNAPELQAELVSLLKPHSEHQIAERRDSLGLLTVGAALALCHQGKDQILVGEIATEVNRIQKDRGERLQYSAEKVGHRLKKAGLLTRRLGAAGNGFLLDHATQVLLHEVAASYGCGGLTDGEENLHCHLCEQNK